MVSTDLKSLRQRLDALGIRQSTFAAFARCHDGDVSRVIKGFHVASAPVERMAEAIAALEDLAAADSEVKIDMSSIQNIRAAQKRLEEKRAESNAATILAEDSKPRWARAVAIAPANPELLTEPLANKV